MSRDAVPIALPYLMTGSPAAIAVSAILCPGAIELLDDQRGLAQIETLPRRQRLQRCRDVVPLTDHQGRLH